MEGTVGPRPRAAAKAGAPAIESRGLSLAYGRKTILSGVDLRMEADGGIVGFAGPNGSGKSTFLRACLGLLPCRAGELRVFGASPGERGFRAMLGGIGWAPQQRAPGTLRLSVRDLVSIGRCAGAGLFRPLGRADREAVEAAMETAGIADLADRAAQELSGGQLQRANLARALVSDPRLLLLDEPTTHLDADSRRSVVALIERIAATRRVSMGIVSHDPAVLSLCGRFFAFGGGGAREARREELDLDD